MLANIQIQSLRQKSLCEHCGTPSSEQIAVEERFFCCLGCRAVWSALKSSGLSDFYSVRNKFVAGGFVPQVDLSSGTDYFDDPLFVDEIVVKKTSLDWQVSFYLPEVYCAACVWLLERLPSCASGVLNSRLNLVTKILVVNFDPSQIKLSQIVAVIKSFGYSLQVLDKDQNRGPGIQNEDLSRLAVAVFSAMNCMMIAVSLYQGWWSGMDHTIRFFLEVVSAIIALPTITYSSKPIIQRAWSGLRAGRISLDLPLAFGIIFGYVFSVFAIPFDLGEVYFDSLTVLVALLLVARFGNNYVLNRFRKQGDMLKSVFPDFALSIPSDRSAKHLEIYVKRLKSGDCCFVKSGMLIPADARITKGTLLIDSSALSGEADPVEFSFGAIVWAGTKVVDGEAELELIASQKDSRFYSSLSRLSENIELGSELIKKIDHRSLLFVSWVFSISLVSFAIHWYCFGFVRAYEVALSIIVISCPCALGISVPFVFTSACLKASRAGIYFISGGAIEKLAKCKKIVFDKTGTLTEGAFSELEVSVVDPETEKITELSGKPNNLDSLILLEKIYLLEYDLLHPIARRLAAYAAENMGDKRVAKLKSKSYKVGISVRGEFEDGSIVEIGSNRILSVSQKMYLESKFGVLKSTQIFVLENQILKIIICATDKIREGMPEVLDELRNFGLGIFMLSGDRKEVVLSTAEKLNINSSDVYYGKTPEEKQSVIIELGQGVVMVGDGINDVLALKASDLGVSVTGGLELLQKVGGVSILDFNAEKLLNAVLGAKSTYRAANINMIFSFCYNLVGTVVAAFGYVSPLVAALLMPISSLCVVLISVKLPKFNYPNSKKD